jgi:methionyl-tRNA synthetase
MDSAQKKLLVTNALPYANDSIHIGHLVGYIQADIWVRFQKLQGTDCLYVCASDAHGTPIMLRAEKIGVDPEELANEYTQEHHRDFKDFLINFDNYYTTHSKENQELIEEIFSKLVKNNRIEKQIIEQAFDDKEQMFLPDRYVRGQCPECGAEDQYGDSCEDCGSTYKPTDLINPISVISGNKPSQKKSEHYFLKLKDSESMLKEWIQTIDIHPSVKSKLNEWFTTGLKNWDISRDDPYFGFKIPEEDDKYFYVWLDAPMGYFASLKNLCEQKENSFDYQSYVDPNNENQLIHFIGKDIIYFHALFWPAVLDGAELKKPDGIYVNGFLTVNGKKMSKSRGTMIKARTYLDHLNPEYLRYYYAYKLNSGMDDFDLDTNDFLHRVNSDLVGKCVNIASRCAKFINDDFNNQLSGKIADQELLSQFQQSSSSIATMYKHREFGRAMRTIMSLADQANRYLDKEKPWNLAKDVTKKEQVQEICTMGLNLFRILMIYLKPVVPAIAKQAEAFLDLDNQHWSDINQSLIDHQINNYEPLLTRLQKENIDAMIDASK